MSGYLAIFTLLLGFGDDNGLRIKVPATPFECSHSRSFCFDKSGRRLTCVTQSGELLVWKDNGENPVVTRLERKPGGGIFDRAPMSAVLASGDAEIVLFYHDGRAQVWNVATGRKIRDLENDREKLGYAQRSPNGELVACLSYGEDGDSSFIMFWNTNDWSISGWIETSERIHDFCFAPNGREVLACVGHPTDQKDLGFTGIIAWNLATRQESGRIEYGTVFPIRIAVSPDGRWVATGGGDAVPIGMDARMLSGHLRIYDWENRKFVVEPYALPSDYVRAVQFSPDSQSLYSGGYSTPEGGGRYKALIKSHSVGDWTLAWQAKLGHGNPHEICASPNNHDLLVPDEDHLQVIDAQDGTVRGAKLKFVFSPEE